MALNFGFIRNIFNGNELGPEGLIISIALIGITSIAITRNTKNIRIVALPVAIGYGRLGINIHPVIYVLLGIIAILAIYGGGIATQIFSSASAARAEQLQRIKKEKTAKEKRIRDKWTAAKMPQIARIDFGKGGIVSGKGYSAEELLQSDSIMNQEILVSKRKGDKKKKDRERFNLLPTKQLMDRDEARSFSPFGDSLFIALFISKSPLSSTESYIDCILSMVSSRY